jgi:hypothetical protein
MVFSLFSTRASASGEEAFWKWFTANEPRLFSFEKNQEHLGVRVLIIGGFWAIVHFGPLRPVHEWLR